MAVLYDTNLLILLIRDSSSNENVRMVVNPDKEAEYVSLVSVAELKSFAIKSGWGKPRLDKIQLLLDSINVVDINSPLLIDRYVDVDAFSQRKHPTLIPEFKTPRNMGKNDIWIAATASILNFRLITVDGDFKHLNKVLIEVETYLPSDFL